MPSIGARIYRIRKHTDILLKTWILCGYKHRAEINPFRVIWINPNQINEQGISIPKKLRYYCFVIDGDWDLTEERFEDDRTFNMLKEHFQSGVRWPDTAHYQTILDTIKEKGEYWHSCQSESDVQARCAFLDQMFNEIKNTGYKNPQGLNFGETGLTKAFIPEEIAVGIGRDGKILLETGRHRLSIVKILELPLVPVRVMVRHKLWQDTRDQIVFEKRHHKPSDHPRSIISHPDIAYLLA